MVTAIIVTRGDVDLEPVLSSLPKEWELLVWSNNENPYLNLGRDNTHAVVVGGKDLAVYGRYAAIEYARNDLIYVQDDDCVVSDPAAFPKLWELAGSYPWDGRTDEPWGSDPRDTLDHVVCNMPTEFRHEFYSDHALVGFGACFHRDAPARAFAKMFAPAPKEIQGREGDFMARGSPEFARTCDIVFTGLTPRVLVDIPKQNLWWAEDESRMYRQPEHVAERARTLELVKKVRDS